MTGTSPPALQTCWQVLGRTFVVFKLHARFVIQLCRKWCIRSIMWASSDMNLAKVKIEVLLVVVGGWNHAILIGQREYQVLVHSPQKLHNKQHLEKNCSLVTASTIISLPARGTAAQLNCHLRRIHDTQNGSSKLAFSLENPLSLMSWVSAHRKEWHANEQIRYLALGASIGKSSTKG